MIVNHTNSCVRVSRIILSGSTGISENPSGNTWTSLKSLKYQRFRSKSAGVLKQFINIPYCTPYYVRTMSFPDHMPTPFPLLVRYSPHICCTQSYPISYPAFHIIMYQFVSYIIYQMVPFIKSLVIYH